MKNAIDMLLISISIAVVEPLKQQIFQHKRWSNIGRQTISQSLQENLVLIPRGGKISQLTESLENNEWIQTNMEESGSSLFVCTNVLL